MTEPIEYRVLESVQTALRAISVAGGYFHTVQSVAVKLDPDATIEDLIGSSGARPFIFLDLKKKTRTYQPAEQMRVVIPFDVIFVNDSDPETDASMLLTFSRMVADAEQALAIDSERGALAVDTRIGGDEKFTHEGALVWALIPFEVTLHRTYGQPNG